MQADERVKDLAAWLTAILGEDEARLSDPTFCGPVWPTTAQLLARIAADRKILAECMKILAVDWWEYSDAPDLAEFVIRQKAGEYADRPDYPLAVERQGVEQG